MNIIRSTALGASLAFGLVPAMALAQQEGLVNISVEDNVVQVPVGVAAQVCPGVDANVLAQQFVGTSDVACEIDQDVAAEHNIGGGSPGAGQGGGNGGGGQQNGLVNVSIDGNTVQIPVGVAAQVCPGLNANVLARQYAGTSEVACEITQDVAAQNGIGQ